jgi:POT family proton-dependent oligopeptide transporter
VFQAVNPVFILLFGVVFTALWTLLGKVGREPSTPFKFALGLMQLGLGFALYWYGATVASERGMVGVTWLVLGYLLQTTGELCLSPVGLSMVTRLSPLHLVSTVMGTWFLATAFSQYLAAIISQFTGVGHGGGDGNVPLPRDTLMIYGGVFSKIALAALISAGICFLLVPLLKRWTHPEAPASGDGTAH